MHLATEIFLWSAGLCYAYTRSNVLAQMSQKKRDNKIRLESGQWNSPAVPLKKKISVLSKGLLIRFFFNIYKAKMFLIYCSEDRNLFLAVW